MPIYQYKAVSKTGKSSKGTIDAESERQARQRLKGKGLFPTALEEAGAAKAKESKGWNISLRVGGNKVSPNQLAITTRQLSTLVAAGMPVVDAVRALCEQTDHEVLRSVLSEVADEVNEGETLANSMAKHENAFPRLFVNMVSSGEASGKLDLVLERLAELLESQAAMRQKLFSAMTYPVLMLLLCVAVIAVLLAYVVPQITVIFEDQDMVLPLPTRIVIGLSNFTLEYWWAVLAAAGGLFSSLNVYTKSARGRERIDGLKLKLPVVGPMLLKIATGRFARNLGTMLGSGIELLRGLTISKNIMNNVVLEKAITRVAEGVREGRNLSAELKGTKLFPPLLIHMSAIGEKTGAMEAVLMRLANNYETEIDAFISGLTSILEPLLIIVLAMIVGIIIAAVMLPMLEMSSLAGV